MMHRSLKGISSKISEMRIFDRSSWYRGASVYIYGIKSPDERRYKREILIIDNDGMFFHTLYSWDITAFSIDIDKCKLQIIGVDFL